MREPPKLDARPMVAPEIGWPRTLAKRWRPGAWIVPAFLALHFYGCASDPYYNHYRRNHPDWDPDTVLEEPSPLGAVVASIYAPPKRGEVSRPLAVWIIDLTDPRWVKVSQKALASGSYTASDERTYLVVAEVRCLYTELTYRFQNQGFAWFLLPENRLAAFHRQAFARRCAPTMHFVDRSGLPDEFVRCIDAFVEGTFYKQTLPIEPAPCAYPRGAPE